MSIDASRSTARLTSQQGVEPDDVEVEPVMGGQLEHDQQGRAQGGYLLEGLLAGPDCEGQRHQTRESQEGYAERVEAGDLAPNAEGGISVGLVGDRAVVEAVQAGNYRGQRSRAAAVARNANVKMAMVLGFAR